MRETKPRPLAARRDDVDVLRLPGAEPSGVGRCDRCDRDWTSRARPRADGDARTRRRLALLRGVTAVNFDREARPYERVAQEALELLKARGLLTAGMRVLITKGDQPGSGRSNTLLLMDVG